MAILNIHLIEMEKNINIWLFLHYLKIVITYLKNINGKMVIKILRHYSPRFNC